MRAVSRLSVLALAAASLAASAHSAPPAAGPPAGAPTSAHSPAAPLPPKFTAPEYLMGSPRAKVTLTEYASVACPHCAKFDAQVFPALKARYIDTGKVRFALREMLVGDEGMVQVAAAGFLLARCAGRPHYFDVVEAMYRAQATIFTTGELRPSLVAIAKANGLDEAQLDACLADKSAIAALNARVDDAEKVHHVDGTPTFFVNGEKLEDHGKEPDLALFDTALKPLLKAR